MANIEYIYFDVKGVGEGNRLLLAYGGEPWKDTQVALDQWPDLKPKIKFGQLPVLVIDGSQQAQNIPIARFLGRKYGLAGANPEEDFEIDQHVELLNDIKMKLVFVYYDLDKELSDKKHEEFCHNFYPQALEKLNDIIEKNNGHLALGKLTWADFHFAGMYEYIRKRLRMPDLDSKYPSFKQLFDTVYAIPKVKAYSDKSPKICIY